MSDFLDQVRLGGTRKLSLRDKQKLAALGASTSQELLATIRASQAAFKQFYGTMRTSALVKALETMAEGRTRSTLDGARRRPKLGAVIARPAPPLAPPTYDLAERDQLFNELQALRSNGATPQTQRRIVELEQRLNALLESGV